MHNPRLASRYAKSLLDLAAEKNSLEAVLKDMQTLHSICEASREFTTVLRSPIITSDKKQSIINAVLGGQNINDLTKAFISLLVQKGREQNLPEMADTFIAQYKELKNIRTVKLTTAAPVNDNIRKSIEAKVAGFMPKDTIEVNTAVDASLIGGFVLEVGDKLFDSSVKKSLSDIRSKIIDHSYETKI